MSRTIKPYATPVEAAQATKEIVGRWRDGTLDDDVPLLTNQGHLIVGYGLSVYPGEPGDIVPIIPIGGDCPHGGGTCDCDFDEAMARIEIVVECKSMPAKGDTPAWLRDAIKAALSVVVSQMKDGPAKVTLATLLALLSAA